MTHWKSEVAEMASDVSKIECSEKLKQTNKLARENTRLKKAIADHEAKYREMSVNLAELQVVFVIFQQEQTRRICIYIYICVCVCVHVNTWQQESLLKSEAVREDLEMRLAKTSAPESNSQPPEDSNAVPYAPKEREAETDAPHQAAEAEVTNKNEPKMEADQPRSIENQAESQEQGIESQVDCAKRQSFKRNR